MSNTEDSVFVKEVTCSATDQSIDLLTARNEVVLISSGDCYINFDDEVTNPERMLLKANQYLSIHGGSSVRRLHYLALTGSPTINIMALVIAHI